MTTTGQPPVVIGGRYQLVEKVGRGGMGVVYQASDLLTGQLLALKKVTVPTEKFIFSTEDEKSNPGVSLAKEFKTLAGLRHPNIISVLDYGFDKDGQPFYTMELLDKAKTIVDAGKNLAREKQMGLIVQMLQALVYLHRRGVIHRDMKPGNVLVVNGVVKVVDFGLSLFSHRSVVMASHEAAGTFTHMAPEVFGGGKASTAGDLYAVGLMVYEILVGKYPFEVSNVAVLVNQIMNAAPDMAVFGENASLVRVMKKLLEKSRENRYKDASEVLTDLCAATGYSLDKDPVEIRESFLQSARFIGREGELEELTTALEKAKRGTGSVWLVGGESGVGKSRLLEEIRIRALVEGTTVLQGQGMEDGGMSYQLWRNVIRRLVLDVPVDDLEASVLKVIVPDIGELLGKEVAEAPKLEEIAAQQRLSITIAELFKRYGKPMVLLLEDLQWALESLEPLKILSQFVPDLPVALIGDYRDDEKPDIPELFPNAKVIRLKRFSKEEIGDLCWAMLGKEGDSKDLRELLYKETEGNVFFMIEVLRALAEEAGGLRDIGKAELPSEVFVKGINSLLKHRLMRVPAWAVQLLQLASIPGRKLDKNVLHDLAEETLAEYSLDEWLLVLSDAAVIEVVEDQWSFNHDKLRKQVLGTIPEKKKKDIYLRVAEAYEHYYADDIDYAALLTGLWQTAGDIEKEGKFGLIAGKRYLDICDFDAALNLYTRVLKIIPSEDLESRWGAVAGRNSVYGLTGDFEKRKQDDDALIILAKELGDKSRLAEAYYRKGYTSALEGNERIALDYYKKGLKVAKEAKDKVFEAELLSLMSYSEKRLGLIQEAEQTAEEALKKAEACEDDSALLNALINISAVYSELGDLSKAAQLLIHQVELNNILGDKIADIFSSVNLGYVYIQMGMCEKAKETISGAIELSKKIAEKRGIGYAQLNMGLVHIYQGEHLQALETIHQAKSELEHIGDSFGIAASHSYSGLTYAEEGEYKIALDEFTAAMKIFEELGIQGYALDARAGIARSLLGIGIKEEAKEHAAVVWEVLEDQGGTGLEFPIQAYLSCGKVFEVNNDEETTRRVFEVGYRELMDRAEKISDKKWRKSYLENVPAHRRVVKIWEEMN